MLLATFVANLVVRSNGLHPNSNGLHPRASCYQSKFLSLAHRSSQSSRAGRPSELSRSSLLNTQNRSLVLYCSLRSRVLRRQWHLCECETHWWSMSPPLTEDNIDAFLFVRPAETRRSYAPPNTTTLKKRRKNTGLIWDVCTVVFGLCTASASSAITRNLCFLGC